LIPIRVINFFCNSFFFLTTTVEESSPVPATAVPVAFAGASSSFLET